MNATAPRRPADFPHGTTLHALLDAFFSFLGKVTNACYGIGDSQPAEQTAAAALGALAAQHALAERLLAGRWCTVRDALVYGATLDDVAESMALERDEVAAGLRSWADGQLWLNRDSTGQFGITPVEHAEVLALLDRP